MFKLASRWEYGRFHRPGSLLVKIFWTYSILLIGYLWWGDQTELQYSSIGWTYVIYAFSRSLQLRDTRHLRISQTQTMALCTIEDMWASNFKRWPTITPRSLTVSTVSKTLSVIMYLCCETVVLILLLVIQHVKHFSAAMFSCQTVLQSQSCLIAMHKSSAHVIS